MGAVISRHFDVIILDDIVDEENARTGPQRDKLRSWFYTTLMPTLEPDGKLLILGTRYHLRDLYGYLAQGPMRDDFVRYRALDERGEPLWPGKFSTEFLNRAREEAGPIIFNAQYQNDVELMRGRMFREHWIKRYDTPPDRLKVAIGVDLAIGQNSDNDYFAIAVVGRAEDGKLYVLEATRGRYTFDEQAKKVTDAYRKFNRPDRPVVRVGIEATAYQEALPQRLRNETAMPVVSVRPAVDKISRAHALTAFFESGRVLLKDDATQSALIEELLLFPEGKHDDLFDALEIAVNLAAESAGYRDIFHKSAPDIAP
jgi:predicted phage terminase large subunit-like protein